MPRITLDLEASVLRQLEHRRRKTGQTLGQIASELLAVVLTTDSRGTMPLSWTTARMRCRVNLRNKDELDDALGQR